MKAEKTVNQLQYESHQCDQENNTCNQMGAKTKAKRVWRKMYRERKPRNKRKQIEYFDYLLPQTKLNSKNVARQICTRTSDDGGPIVVISNIGSELDITAMINQVLSKNEFSDTSSILLVEPSSDDHDSDVESDCSAICIQLSSHLPYWYRMQCNLEPSISTRRILSSRRGLKISAKGKLYCVDGMQQTVSSFHNKETIFYNRTPNFCSHKVEEKKRENRTHMEGMQQSVASFHNKETMFHNRTPNFCSHKVEENKRENRKHMEGMQQSVASFHNKETMFHHRIPNFCSHKVEEKKRENRKHMQGIQQSVASFHNKETMFHNRTPNFCSHKVEEKKKENRKHMEGMQQSVASFHKETMFHHRIPNLGSHKVEEKKRENRKNKLCQITTPNTTLYHAEGTDTSDRPCCCSPEIEENQTTKHEDGCVAKVSEQNTPVLENQGINYDGYCPLAKANMIQQTSFVFINGALTSVTLRVIPLCGGCHNPGSHPEDMIPYYKPTLRPYCRPKHSRMLDLDSGSEKSEMVEHKKQSEPCQCSPEKIKEIFKQVIKEKTPNLKTTGCGGATDDPPTQPPTEAPAKPPTNQAANNKQPISIDPAIKPLRNSGNNENMYGNYPNQNINEKVEIECSGRKRTVTIEPKVVARSMGCQRCCGEDSMVQADEFLKLLGPTVGVCQMEPGGTCCQAERKSKALDLRKIGSDSACATDGKNGKKNKNVICESPSEPETESKLETEPDEDLLSVKHSLFRNHQWVDEKQILKQKSVMTQRQSGFRIFKKKKRPPPPEPEFTVEDAVKYCVSINPDLLKNLCPKFNLSEPKECPCLDHVHKKFLKYIFSRNNKVQRESPASAPTSGGTPKSAHFKDAPPPEPVPEPRPEDEAPSGGIKFTIEGKGLVLRV